MDHGLSRRFLSVACTLLATALSSYALLKLGFSVSQALAYPVATACVFWGRHRIHRAGFLIWRVVRQMVSPLSKRQTYRFRLRTLFILVAFICCALGWLSYKRHLLDVEYRALRGRWRALTGSGEPIIVKGEAIIIEISPSTTTLVAVSSDIRSLDFRTPDGTASEAIYRWEGDRLRVREVSPGARRPASFDKHELTLKPGAAAGSYSQTDYVLERITLTQDGAGLPGFRRLLREDFFTEGAYLVWA